MEMNRIILILISIMTGLTTLISNKISAQVKAGKIKWTVAATLPDASPTEKSLGVAGPVAGISNDVLIVAGGANFPDGMPWNGAKKIYQDEIYVFHKKKGRISKGKVSMQRLPQPIAYCASVSTGNGIIYLGGENENGISDKVVWMQYNAKDDTIHFTSLPSLPLPLTNAAAALVNNKIFIAGGDKKDGTSSQFFSLDLSLPHATWQTLATIPVTISFAVMAVQSNGENECIYLSGGRSKTQSGISTIYNSVYAYNLKSNQWLEKAPLPYTLSAGTGISIGSNEILLFSGDKGETFSKVEKMNLAIGKEKDEPKKQELVKEKIALLNAHSGFTKEVLLYNTVLDKWESAGSIPFDAPVTTTALKWGDCIIIPSGEIRAGVRTPQILSGKL